MVHWIVAIGCIVDTCDVILRYVVSTYYPDAQRQRDIDAYMLFRIKKQYFVDGCTTMSCLKTNYKKMLFPRCNSVGIEKKYKLVFCSPGPHIKYACYI